MTAKNPKVSVIMPVFNNGADVRAAITSILNQTLSDFEFIIINDASTDNSRAEILAIKDNRIVYLENPTTLGLITNLNRCLEMAKGEFIARMDGDDLSLPERLAKQVLYLQSHPLIGVCGTWSTTFGEGINSWETKYPENHEAIKVWMSFNTTLTHPTIMFRKQIITKFNLRYDSEYLHIEDYELWTRLLDISQIANVPEFLFKYHVHQNQISTKYKDHQAIVANKIRLRLLEKAGVNASIKEAELHQQICSYKFQPSDIFLIQTANWFNHIYQGNKKTGYFDSIELKKFYNGIWKEILDSNKKYSKSVILKCYLTSSMLRGWNKKAYLNLLLNKPRNEIQF